MLIKRTSRYSGIEHTTDIPVTPEQLKAWQESDRPIQYALPHLTKEHREFLLTGITPDEWNELFGEEE